MNKSIAFIPARSGSKRLSHKNIKMLKGHPLLAYSISSALTSRVFEKVVCVTDSPEYAEIAERYGAEVPLLRPNQISGDKSPDIEWLTWILSYLRKKNRYYETFSILRPTNPFRKAETIKDAYKKFLNHGYADSLRAVHKCLEHPGKMWVIQNSIMQPLFPFKINSVPWHSNQYAALPEIYVQNASLEISLTKNVYEKSSISGDIVIPLVSKGFEGFDINTEEDFMLAEEYLKKGFASLPEIHESKSC